MTESGSRLIVEGRVLPIPRANIDTDQIIPAHYLTRIDANGMGEHLFEGMPDGADLLARHRDATIIVTGENFGCGSSREHAVWALEDHGIRAVIAPSFADIFRGNALSCGLLPVTLAEHDVRALIDLATEDPGVECIVDLEDGTVTAGDLRFEFELEPSERRNLLEGLDAITVTLHSQGAIAEYEAHRPAWLPDLARLEETA